MKKIINYEGNQYIVEYYNDWILEQVEKNNTFFEIQLLEQLRNKVSDFSHTIDIGGNIGNHSFYFTNICGAKKITAFEPIKSNANLFKINNPLAKLYNVALSDFEGSCDMFNPNPWNEGTYKMGSSSNFKTYPQIEVKIFDNFNLKDISFVKIDVEGEEVKVLKGMKNTLSSNLPQLCVEIHKHLGVNLHEVLEVLPKGYTHEYLGEDHYLFTPLK